jgi:hypothetical protein
MSGRVGDTGAAAEVTWTNGEEPDANATRRMTTAARGRRKVVVSVLSDRPLIVI